MPIITALRPDRRKGRWICAFDEGRALTVSELVAARFGLRAGLEIPYDRVGEIDRAETIEAVYDRALKLLDIRPRREQEMRTRLIERGHAVDTIETVIQRLLQDGLLDDLAFARLWVDQKSNAPTDRQHGKNRISRDLAQRGISPDIIREVLNSLQDSDDADRARKLIEAETHVHPTTRKDLAAARRRIGNMLLHRGYDAEIVETLLDEVLAPNFDTLD